MEIGEGRAITRQALPNMANAFACTKHDRLKRATQAVAPAKHEGFFEQRHANSIVTINVGDQEKNFLPGCGVLMGDKNAPQLFNRS